jgi:hypothetical protein
MQQRLMRPPLAHVPFSEELLDAPPPRPSSCIVHVSVAPLARGDRRRLFLRLSRAGLSSAIDDLEALEADDASDMVELFLHDPGIRRPIEPFSAMLLAMLRRTTLAVEEALALFAAAPQPENSVEGQAVDEFMARVPQDNPDCLACPSFPICQAYGVRTGSCAVWRAVIGSLACAARAMRAESARRH